MRGVSSCAKPLKTGANNQSAICAKSNNDLSGRVSLAINENNTAIPLVRHRSRRAIAVLLMIVGEPGYARQTQAQRASPGVTSAPETVIVSPSASMLKPFDIVICQSHGNFFP